MFVLVGLFRLVVVALGLVGTRAIWRDGDVEGFVYFTNLTSFLAVAVFGWAAVTTLRRREPPPVGAKGLVTLAAAITGLVAWLVLAPEDPDAPAVFLGLTDGQVEHRALPIAVVLDFLLFDPHRRARLRDAGLWMLFPVLYFGAILLRGQLSPGSEYPYGFIDLDALGWGGLGLNLVLYGGAFYALGLLVVAVDRVLPARPLGGNVRE
ncbi:Pr6Pr family membrane protein [Isoptericola nanjingensis]|uniref:Pr6Pr family membrane protein n=1 Tax=Isoptericola TaxID=254250 RepID=UPI003D1A0345|nr:Pr6Pr family membrane protein [Isoptericola sp. QY 916]